MERRRKFGDVPEDAWDDDLFASSSLSTTSPLLDRTLSTASEPPVVPPRGGSKRGSIGSSHGTTVLPSLVPSLKRASVEIPCHLDGNGTLSAAAKSRLAVTTSVPVARSLLATVQSHAGIRGRIGHASTHAELRYTAAPWASFTGGVVLAERPTFQAGANASLRGQCTQLSVRLGSLKPDLWTQPHLWKDVSCKASWSQDIASFVTLRSGLGVSSLSIFQTPSIQNWQPATSASVSLVSRHATHKWNTGLMWTRLDRRPKLVVSVSPRLASRVLSISGWYNWWDASWSATTSLSKSLAPQSSSSAAQLSVGWVRSGKEGWTYVLSWAWNGITVRVPIALSAALLDPFWYPVQLAYVTAATGVLQDILALMLFHNETTRSSASDPLPTSNGTPSSTSKRRAKAQREAANQQLLMRRTAQNRMEREREQQGLVISRATYHTPLESLDVTVPLQFWVADSVLELGAASKKDLLGFYDLSYRAPAPKDASVTPTSWWAGFWSSIHRSPNGAKDAATPPTKVTPQLRVEYSFRGELHVTSIQDHEPLSLPSLDLVN